MDQNTQLIKSIILTLKNELVVVPNAAVAEIISVQDVREVGDSPQWLLGKARWRGVEVPVHVEDHPRDLVDEADPYPHVVRAAGPLPGELESEGLAAL